MKNTIDNKTFFNVAISIIVIAVLSIFFIAVYESFTGSQIKNDSFLGNPEIVAVIIGLIISVLFVERWKSLESRVQKLSEGPVDTMNEIQTFAKQEIEQKFKQVETKAQSLKATVSSLVEKHPWLEVITDREIIVETDSVRAIIRTCYSLLRDNKVLHLFEYLEYCSTKGVGTGKTGSKLKGTADDFAELSFFCEAYLGDYYLSSIFLQRYLEQYPDSSQILTPTYIRKLLKIGDLKGVSDVSKSLRHKVYGSTLYNQIKILLKMDHPVSERYKWDALNALLLSDTALCEFKRVEKYKKDLKRNKYTTLFKDQQFIYDIEYNIFEGNFDLANQMLSQIKTENADPLVLVELSYLYAKLGNYSIATKLKDSLNIRSKELYGEAYEYSKENFKSNSGIVSIHNNIGNEQSLEIESKHKIEKEIEENIPNVTKPEKEIEDDSAISPKAIKDKDDEIERK